MKLLLIALTGLFPFSAFANPACIVCTVAVGASLEVARRLGISDNIVGLWSGAMLAVLGYWTIAWFDKKNWHFAGRDFWLMALCLSAIGFVYSGLLVYTPQIIAFLYIDPFLLSAASGACIFVFSQKFYQYLKQRNRNHAHFPFEKVVLPLVILFAASIVIHTHSL